MRDVKPIIALFLFYDKFERRSLAVLYGQNKPGPFNKKQNLSAPHGSFQLRVSVMASTSLLWRLVSPSDLMMSASAATERRPEVA